MKKLIFIPILAISFGLTFLFGVAIAQTLRLSVEVPSLTLHDEDSEKLPGTFLLKDDDGSDPLLIMTGPREFLVGDDIMVNEEPYQIEGVQQAVTLKPLGDETMTQPRL